MLIVSDSLFSNLSCYPEILRKYFNNHGTLNFGIARDLIHCDTNNIDHNFPQCIARTIISTGLEFQKKCHKFQALIISLLRKTINTQEDVE